MNEDNTTGLLIVRSEIKELKTRLGEGVDRINRLHVRLTAAERTIDDMREQIEALKGEQNGKPNPLICRDDPARGIIKAWSGYNHLVEFQIYKSEEDDGHWCQIDGRIDGSTDTHSISLEGNIRGAVRGKKYTAAELYGED